jgi:hypothetical protein
VGLLGPEYENLLNSMQKLYARLEEPDLVVGVAALRTEEPGLDSLVLYHQAVGNFQDALCCYERQRVEGELSYSGMIQCYLAIDQPAAAANLAAGQSGTVWWARCAARMSQPMYTFRAVL